VPSNNELKKPIMENLAFKISKGEREVYPTHEMVKNWLFKGEAAEEEANLAQAMAIVAEKNGINANQLQHLFPAVLRMLKSNSRWAQ
jgi:hypothetical protein